jgi:catechol-2,3-dioxygenase
VPQIVGFHHVSLTVSDCERSTRWYTEVLGFEIVFTESSEQRSASVLRFPGAGYGVGLTQHASGDGCRFDPTRVGLDHVAFTVAERADLDRWAETLTAAGVEHSGVIDVPPGAILNFKDPDGIALALFWDRAEPD